MGTDFKFLNILLIGSITIKNTKFTQELTTGNSEGRIEFSADKVALLIILLCGIKL